MMNPKKIIGSLGRRYGGRPFQLLRKFVYDTVLLPGQVMMLRQIRRKRYKPGTEEFDFYQRHYVDGGSARVTRGVISMYDGRLQHGGITDRLKGALSTYHEARRRGLPFYIYWRVPFKLEDYFEPAKVDWRIDDGEISSLRGDAFPVLIDEKVQYQAHLNNHWQLMMALHKALPQTQVYSNADNFRGSYREMYNELFKPTPLLRDAVGKHLGNLGERYYAFSFRFIGLLGDFSDYPGIVLSDEDGEALISKVIAEFKKLVGELPDDARIFVTADSVRFLRSIKPVDERIYIVEGDVKHTDFDEVKNDEIWLKTFVDQALLMCASKVTLMVTGRMYRSDFSRFAAEIGGVEFVCHEF